MNTLTGGIAAVALLALTGCGGAAEATVKTPSSCIQALDDSEAVLDIVGEMPEVFQEGLAAALWKDVSGLRDNTAKIKTLTAKFETARQAADTSAQQCRTESK